MKRRISPALYNFLNSVGLAITDLDNSIVNQNSRTSITYHGVDEIENTMNNIERRIINGTSTKVNLDEELNNSTNNPSMRVPQPSMQVSQSQNPPSSISKDEIKSYIKETVEETVEEAIAKALKKVLMNKND